VILILRRDDDATKGEDESLEGLPEDGRTDLARLGARILGQRCQQCNHILLPDIHAVRQHATNILHKTRESSGITLQSYVDCRKCSSTTCIGCGSSSSGAARTRRHDDSLIFLQCCAEGRLFLIWLLLCSKPDGAATSKQPTFRKFFSLGWPSRKSIAATTTTSAPATPSQRPRAVLPSGVGFGSNETLVRSAAHPEPRASDPSLGAIRSTYHALATLLPSIHREEDFDKTPPRELLAMLQRSPLLEEAIGLLRNFSVENCAPILPLYRSMLLFINAASQHPITAPAVFKNRFTPHKEQTLIHISLGLPSAANRSAPAPETEALQPISNIIEDIGKQAELILKNSSSRGAVLADQETLDFCSELKDLADFLKANKLERTKGASTSTSLIEHVSEPTLLQTHFYAAQANAMVNGAPALSRMKKLIFEISNLQLSLPEGVYVRHGSSRLDIMKILIAGPYGTPYENGLFEFDLLCPLEYPNTPPMIRFKTTGGPVSRIRFNPNLYEDGKGMKHLILWRTSANLY
jgi:hypothetical protein